MEILSPKMFCSDPRLVCVGSPVLVGKLDGGGGEVGWREGAGALPVADQFSRLGSVFPSDRT